MPDRSSLRGSSLRAHAVDALLALLLATVDIALAGNILRESPDSWRLPVSAAVAAAIAVLLAIRRRWPAAALAAITTLALPAAVTGVLWDPFVGAALALSTLVTAQRTRIALPINVGAVALVAAGAGELLRPGAAWWYAAGAPLAALGWWLGTLSRERRAQAAELAAQREHAVLADERLRIARELHDVLTHGMGLIAVQAAVANHIADARPEAAREALVTIEAASREALADVRRLLGTLRDEALRDEPLREDAGRTPPPALADLPAVVARAGAAGVEVELTVADAADLPAAVELAAYRIVQEAVTNVVKHAAPTSCRATVEVVDGVVRVEVTNEGPAPAAPGGAAGHGLVGMRERVALYGGEFSAEPREAGGFRVLATLPYQRA